ncbi:exporter of polyketide antibiotics [Lentibacillus kapialis]|uniref:Exporter of polyketide antibiotics n=1 Tax=Lentibacillus kapialis TaxID=340214 RepID=A0A917Q1P9_9BACI|nr:ABC transporter permease [Lentibacillus kapialis]GGK05999.1 exporter of polyketide antibiotics [Lentibacillus kapialis]
MANPFKEMPHIMGLLVRQLRLKILLWLAGFAIIIVATITAYPSVYPDEEARRGFAITMNNPAMEAMVGSSYSLQDFLSTTATLFAQETMLFTLVTVAVMNIMLVSRMTRGDEEEGRTEYIRSLPIGRLSYLGAAMLVITVVNILLAAIIGTGLWATDIDGTDWQSAYLYGSILGGVGLVFAGITAFLAQLAETARGTTMISFGVLAVAYLVRAFGDVSSDTLSLISPLGWGMRTNVFIQNDWWPVYSCLIAAFILTAGAFYLHRTRDLDAGFIPPKPGNEHASIFLKTPLGFTVHEQRVPIIVWAVFIVLFSASFGYILDDLETYFADNPFLEKMMQGESDVKNQFVTLLIAMMSLISAVPAVITIMALKKEETANRIENFLSKAISRTTVMSNYLWLAVITSILMQALIALGLWGASIAVLDQPLDAGDIFLAAFMYLAAIWVLLGLSILVIGLVPKIASIIWLYLIYGFIIIFLGDVLDLPDWANNLSVFETVPALPSNAFDRMPVILLLGISLVTSLAGFISYNKRDIQG